MMGQLPSGACGVRILGTGSAVPERRLTNAYFARMMETSDEWITQRTGIRERRVLDLRTEGCSTLSRLALERAIQGAGIKAEELDLVIVATVTMEMTCPSVACRIAAAVGARNAAAFDLAAACSGFVYGLNMAEGMVRAGRFRTVAVIGAEAMSSILDYTDRTVSILFGDAAGCAIIRADEDASKGCIYQHMGADGSGSHALYIPRSERDVPAEDAENPIRLGCLRMNGKEVFRFAVTKFKEVMGGRLREDGAHPRRCEPGDLPPVECAHHRRGAREAEHRSVEDLCEHRPIRQLERGQRAAMPRRTVARGQDHEGPALHAGRVRRRPDVGLLGMEYLRGFLGVEHLSN